MSTITYKGGNVRATSLEINLENFKYNMAEIQKYVGDSVTLMPVIKANAYGTHINKRIELMNNYEIVAVAIAEEANCLRNNGYKGEILILNQPDINDIDTILKQNVSIGMSSTNFLKQIVLKKQKAKVHLELETGMGRTGIYLKDLDEFIKCVKQYENINVEGVYTHLSSADNDEDFTKEQLSKFEEGALKIKEEFSNLKYIHSSASNGLLNFKSDICNLVRPGIILYGYQSSSSTLEKIDLKPIAKLKSKISFIKEVEKDTSISYGRTFIADKKMKVATIAIGYADGIRRSLSNKGYVVINGKKEPIIGTVCMDSFMVDVTEILDAKLGDEVYIWDNEIITLEDIAKWCDTINYEILSTISDRVPRVFK
jgi:alanine racemase